MTPIAVSQMRLARTSQAASATAGSAIRAATSPPRRTRDSGFRTNRRSSA